MNCEYHNLPPTFQQEFFDLLDEVQTQGIEPVVLEALLIAPLVSDHIAEVETVAVQRLDTLREALRTNAIPIMRLLSRLSFLLFLEYLTRFFSQNNPGRKRDGELSFVGMIHFWSMPKRAINPMWSTFGVPFIRPTARHMISLFWESPSVPRQERSSFHFGWNCGVNRAKENSPVPNEWRLRYCG